MLTDGGSVGRRLRLPKYHVVAMKPEMEPYTSELAHALVEGVIAVPDETRAGFYIVELSGQLLYIHVYNDRRKVYVVAHLTATRGTSTRDLRILKTVDFDESQSSVVSLAKRVIGHTPREPKWNSHFLKDRTYGSRY